MKKSIDLAGVENAILALLDAKKEVFISDLLKALDAKGYPESEIRRAVWALLSAHEIEVSKDYSLRRTAVCA